MGSICATVTNVQKDRLECSIQNEGTIYENSQISFSTYKEDPAALGTDQVKDLTFARDVRFCLEHDVDYIIHSVYEGHAEIKELKRVIQQENEGLAKERGVINEVKVIAKLENEEAIKDIEEILNVADAIMIPRGVLGTVLPIEKISWI